MKMFSITLSAGMVASSWWMMAMPALLRLSRVLERHLLALKDHAAAIARDDAAQDVDQRGLASAVFAHQGVHLAGAHVQSHLAQRLYAAEVLGNVDNLQHQLRHSLPY